MARIRSIKPEYWTSEQVVECSPMARLLFIGLWNFCDDNGVHPASAKRAKMEVFPSDDLTEGAVKKLIDELLTTGLLAKFEVDGKSYWNVTGWHHQKIERPSYKFPAPPKSTSDPRGHGEDSTSARRVFADDSPPDGKGCREDVERNGGGKKNTNPPSPSSKHSALLAQATESKTEGDGGGKPIGESLPDRFAEAFEAVKGCGLRLAHDAVTKALRQGFSVDGILGVVDIFHSEPGKWSEGALHERLTAAGMAEFAPHEGWVQPNPEWSKRQPKPRAIPAQESKLELPSSLEPLYGDRLDRMTADEISALSRDSPRLTQRDRADAPKYGKTVKELRAKLLAAMQDRDSTE